MRWSAPLVGALGIVGALLAPPAVGADPAATITLLFLAVATAAATAVVVVRRWDWLALATFVVATPQWLAWLFEEGRDPFAAVAVLAGFGALGAAAAVGFELRRRAGPARRESAILLVGLVRDVQPLRLAALTLLGATVVKVFLYDLAALTSLARVASFIVLGLLLLGGAFAWQRLRPPSAKHPDAEPDPSLTPEAPA